MSRPVHHAAKRQGTTSADIFDRLIEAVLSGKFAAGSTLREAKLAREWQVSRTPMREAVRRAAEAGFLVLRPNQAPLVRPLTVQEMRDLYEVRELLELRAFARAWDQMDPNEIKHLHQQAADATPGQSRQWIKRCLAFDLALHRTWLDRCGNAWLKSDLERLYQFLRIVQSWMSADPAAMKNAHHEHLEILTALHHADKQRATAALQRHIRHAGEVVCATLAAKQSISS
jgi:DNA-binding GntR family transcriptional regulator